MGIGSKCWLNNEAATEACRCAPDLGGVSNAAAAGQKVLALVDRDQDLQRSGLQALLLWCGGLPPWHATGLSVRVLVALNSFMAGSWTALPFAIVSAGLHAPFLHPIVNRSQDAANTWGCRIRLSISCMNVPFNSVPRCPAGWRMAQPAGWNVLRTTFHSAWELSTQQLLCRLESRTASGLDSVEGSEPPEPSWELPPELQEFSGNKGDRHALLQFKQQQQVGAGIQAQHGSLESIQAHFTRRTSTLHCSAHILGHNFFLSVCAASICKGSVPPQVQPTSAILTSCRQLGLTSTLSEPSGRRLSAGGPRWISSDGASNRWVQP